MILRIFNLKYYLTNKKTLSFPIESARTSHQISFFLFLFTGPFIICKNCLACACLSVGFTERVAQAIFTDDKMPLGPVSSKELSLATFFSSGKKCCRGSEGREVLQTICQAAMVFLLYVTSYLH